MNLRLNGLAGMTHSLEEVADKLSVSVETVKRWVRSGELAAINTSRNRNSRRPRLRILDYDLQAFLNRRRTLRVVKTRRRKKVKDYPKIIE